MSAASWGNIFITDDNPNPNPVVEWKLPDAVQSITPTTADLEYCEYIHNSEEG